MRLHDALQNPVDSAILTRRNHSMDNSFLRREAGDVEYRLMEHRYTALGISFNVPFGNHYEKQIAFVYEHMDETYWVHMPVVMWLRFMTDYHGRYPCEAIKKVMGVYVRGKSEHNQ